MQEGGEGLDRAPGAPEVLGGDRLGSEERFPGLPEGGAEVVPDRGVLDRAQPGLRRRAEERVFGLLVLDRGIEAAAEHLTASASLLPWCGRPAADAGRWRDSGEAFSPSRRESPPADARQWLNRRRPRGPGRDFAAAEA